MSILAVCPDCSKEYKVPDERAGSKFRCKVCKGVIHVEELEESPIIQERREKVERKQKLARKKSQKIQQNLVQVIMILVGVAALAGVGLAAMIMPAFRETLGQVLVVSGIGCFMISWIVIMWTEEEMLIRMLVRFFPPAILICIFTRLNEIWPWALLGVGGIVATVGGLGLRGF